MTSNPLDTQHHCPNLGLIADPETWYGFPARENRCHKTTNPQLVALTYQQAACLTANHNQCPLFQHEGKWRSSLPDFIRRETQDLPSPAQWNSEWMARVDGQPLSEAGTFDLDDIASDEDAFPADDKPTPSMKKSGTRGISPLLFIVPLLLGGLIISGAVGVWLIFGQRTNARDDMPTSTVFIITTATTMIVSTPMSLPTASTAPPTAQPTTSTDASEPTTVPPSPTQENVLPVQGKAVLAFDSNMRVGPGTDFDAIELVTAGTQVELLARDNPALWVLIRLVDGREGWIAASQFVGNIDVQNLPLAPNIPTP